MIDGRAERKTRVRQWLSLVIAATSILFPTHVSAAVSKIEFLYILNGHTVQISTHTVIFAGLNRREEWIDASPRIVIDRRDENSYWQLFPVTKTYTILKRSTAKDIGGTSRVSSDLLMLQRLHTTVAQGRSGCPVIIDGYECHPYTTRTTIEVPADGMVKLLRKHTIQTVWLTPTTGDIKLFVEAERVFFDRRSQFPKLYSLRTLVAEWNERAAISSITPCQSDSDVPKWVREVIPVWRGSCPETITVTEVHEIGPFLLPADSFELPKDYQPDSRF